MVIEYVPTAGDDGEGPSAPRQLELAMDGFVQMELLGLEGSED